jgi:hypothetical protein
MAENQENQGQAGNNQQSGGQTDSPSNRQSSEKGVEGFRGEHGQTSSKDSQSSETGTQTEKSQKETGDPGRTPGKAEGEDDSSATS